LELRKKNWHLKCLLFIVSFKESKFIEKPTTKLHNSYTFVTKQQGHFATVGNDATIKNKKYANYVLSIEKEEFKKSSFLALNIDNKYFLFQYTKSKGENILDIKLFD